MTTRRLSTETSMLLIQCRHCQAIIIDIYLQIDEECVFFLKLLIFPTRKLRQNRQNMFFLQITPNSP